MARCTIKDLQGKINRLNNNIAGSKSVKNRHDYFIGHDASGYTLRYTVGSGWSDVAHGTCSELNVALTAVNKILEEEVE